MKFILRREFSDSTGTGVGCLGNAFLNALVVAPVTWLTRSLLRIPGVIVLYCPRAHAKSIQFNGR
jgi:hypothetical protein